MVSYKNDFSLTTHHLPLTTKEIMRCPFCGNLEDKVVDSREAKDGDSIRRRRECLGCERRFTSYERIDEIPYMVVKKDGRREKFDRSKIMSGLLRASEKRPISATQLEEIVDKVETFVQDSPDRESLTNELGKIIMRELKKLDKVAYVRFASVYLEFEDVSEFMKELKYLVRARRPKKKTDKKTKSDESKTEK